jgi:hypothetical protein
MLRAYSMLGNALEQLWTDDTQGMVDIDSLVILRAFRRLVLPDVGNALHEPSYNSQKLESEIKLLLNTIDHVL